MLLAFVRLEPCPKRSTIRGPKNMRLKVRSTCTAAVGCVLKGRSQDGASIQLLSHYDQPTKHKEKKIWSLHAATFRCVFGTNCKVTFDKSTGERIMNIPVDIDKRTHAVLDHVLDSHIYACPPQHDLEQCFVDVPVPQSRDRAQRYRPIKIRRRLKRPTHAPCWTQTYSFSRKQLCTARSPYWDLPSHWQTHIFGNHWPIRLHTRGRKQICTKKFQERHTLGL